VHVHDRLYIGGAWVASSGPGFIDVVNCATEEVMGRVPEGSVDDVERAVAAASDALDGWAATPVEDRAKTLERLS
jgi:acyl-CoA reductase-like NAD-dependent aldehyde dehydrogenase